MALNIKNTEVETLLKEVIQMTGESKTEAVRKALEERRQRLVLQIMDHKDEIRLFSFLEDEIWSQIPADLLGTRLTKEEEEAILGFGKFGV